MILVTENEWAIHGGYALENFVSPSVYEVAEDQETV
jgi:hypothetical protein